MKTQKLDTPNGAIAVHESEGRGPAAVLIHGNSSSSRAFSRQLDGPLGQRFRLVAIDLPGHGASADAKDPALYSIKNQARTLLAAIDALGLKDARFVGWSLGGHFVLELAPDLPHARGLLIFGAPPLAFPPRWRPLSCPIRPWASASPRRSTATRRRPMSRRSSGPASPTFLHSSSRTLCARTDARAAVGASIAPGGYHDEAVVITELKAPLAVLHGADDQIVNGAYFASLAMPTLWRGAVQIIPGAGHAPQWETPEAFDALLAAFIAETA